MPKYSQVFLADKRICERIAGAVDGGNFNALIEIGPGKGALTEFLYPRYGDKLTAIEIDPEMVSILSSRFSGLKIVNEDFLEADLGKILPSSSSTAFIGNLPYECSTAILSRTLSLPGFVLAVYMFQKEVARKITAVPGTGVYSYLSVMSQAQSSVTLLTDVMAGSFRPIPEVDSSVLVFRPRSVFSSVEQKEMFMKLVKAAFLHRRKTLINSLCLSGIYAKEKIISAMEKTSIKPNARPQELFIDDYLRLLESLRTLP